MRSKPTTTNTQTIKPPQNISGDDARELRDEEGIPEVDTGMMTVGLLVVGCNSV